MAVATKAREVPTPEHLVKPLSGFLFCFIWGFLEVKYKYMKRYKQHTLKKVRVNKILINISAKGKKNEGIIRIGWRFANRTFLSESGFFFKGTEALQMEEVTPEKVWKWRKEVKWRNLRPMCQLYWEGHWQAVTRIEAETWGSRWQHHHWQSAGGIVKAVAS